jgi:Na+/H+ antiporter NhaD/arsenite permease-like protein
MNIPVCVLAVVFTAIAVRQVGAVRLQIWQIMLSGAAVVLLTGNISPSDALHAIDIDIMLFLFGMFVLGQALEASGYLAHLAYHLFRKAKSTETLLFFVVVGFGLLSALLMNDTIAVIGTPLMLLLARQHGITPKPLLLALAFAVTTGSVMSPIGNPQNLLIALNGNIPNPFFSFGCYLLLPTLLNLLVTVLFLQWFYPGHFGKQEIELVREQIIDHDLARLARYGLFIVAGLALLKMALGAADCGISFPLTWIALLGMLPVVLFSPKRGAVLRAIDWQTLGFFASMFVLMQSVWQSGFFQGLLVKSGMEITSIPAILTVSITLSQLISNVPLVALYMPVLMESGVPLKALIALAAGSTIAGNMLILGAASNVIVLQNAENRGADAITFFEFARIGIPLTAIHTLVYWGFLMMVP